MTVDTEAQPAEAKLEAGPYAKFQKVFQEFVENGEFEPASIISFCENFKGLPVDSAHQDEVAGALCVFDGLRQSHKGNLKHAVHGAVRNANPAFMAYFDSLPERLHAKLDFE